MDVTDRTIEQVLDEVFNSGNILLIALCCFIIGLALGAFGMFLYFTKLRYYSLENELKNTKKTLTQVESERDEYKQKFEAAQNRAEHYQSMEYARLATEPDAVPVPPC